MNLLRHANLVFLGLLLAGFVNAPLSAAPKQLRPELTDLKFEFPPMRFAWLEARNAEVAIRTPEKNWVACGGAFRPRCVFIELCGFPEVASRESELRDPTGVIATAYGQCRTIVADRFENRVRVEYYPEGFFGDMVSEGMLRTERREITSEAERAALFTLLVESTEVAENEMEYEWPDAATGGTTARDIRSEVGLIPDAALEFSGEKPLRIEISLKQGRMLVLAGEKWGLYRLDRAAVGAFEEFFAPVSEVVR